MLHTAECTVIFFHAQVVVSYSLCLCCPSLIYPCKVTVIVGLHDRRSLQLFPKLYYYASPTLRSETTLPLKDHSTYVKITTPCNRWFFFSIDPVPSCHYILFSLTTPRRVWNFCDSVKRIENRAEKLHTYATFWSHLCQKLAYCKKSRARKISRVVPHERRKIVLSVPYILKIMSSSLWLHETVLQTSATNIQHRKVANYFLDGVVVWGPAA